MAELGCPPASTLFQATIIESLDRHSGATTAILTAALVIVTSYYAWMNRAMVAEMKRARDAAVLPKLALEFHRLGPTAMTLAVKSVGLGAALNVDVSVTWESVDGGSAPAFRWRTNVLVPGEQADFLPPGDSVGDSLNTLPANFTRVRLVGSMSDAAGNQHAVSESFEDLPEWRAVLAGAHQRWVIADRERRAADELYKKFERPMRDLTRATDGVARAVQQLTPPDEVAEDA